MPKFTKLISCDRLEDSTVACFLADDGRSHVAEFSHDVCQALLRELQTAAIGQTQELLALTITGHATAVGVGADGKALVIRTREIGTIALPRMMRGFRVSGHPWPSFSQCRLRSEKSKYPPAEPGALVLEPLEAAYPCCTSQASHPLCGMPHASPTAEPLQPAVPAICAPLGVA
jgi:hypothetical protein